MCCLFAHDFSTEKKATRSYALIESKGKADKSSKEFILQRQDELFI
jgi:hypothetical protein